MELSINISRESGLGGIYSCATDNADGIISQSSMHGIIMSQGFKSSLRQHDCTPTGSFTGCKRAWCNDSMGIWPRLRYHIPSTAALGRPAEYHRPICHMARLYSF